MHDRKLELANSTAGKPGRANWVFFYGSVFFFMANLFAAIAVFPAYSLSIGSTTFQAGLQNTAFALSAVLLRLFLGPVMDKQGPKPLMLLGIFSFITAPLLILLYPAYNTVLLARIIQSLGLAVVLPGISTLVADMAPTGRIGAYLGTTRIFFNLALLAGPSGALILIETYGYNHWFVISAITGIISFALLSSVITPPVKNEHKEISGSLRQLKKVIAQQQIYPIIASIAVFSFTYSAVISFAAVHIETAAPGSEAAYFFVVLGFTGIIACLSAGALSDHFGRQRVAWPVLITLGTGSLLFSFLSACPALLIICAIILGIGIQGSSLVFAAWLIDLSKPGLRATTISLQENTIDICFAAGALSFGLAAQGPGLGAAFFAAGMITIFSVVPLSRKSAIITGRHDQ